MSSKLEKSRMQRYESFEVVDHLASNYVMGLLKPLVRRRVDALRNQFDYVHIDQRISYWEQKLSPLNDTASELQPLPASWENIQAQLNMGQQHEAMVDMPDQTSEGPFAWLSNSLLRWSSALSLVLCIFLGFTLWQQEPSLGELSYVAVLEDSNNSPQVVAATYGDSKKLVLDILTLPEIDQEQSFELWVTSKTDNQTRSLGEIPQGTNSFDRQLSEAEWRLIADSSFLIISVEDEGGSALGEPSEMVISRGLCIRLATEGEQTRV